MKMDDRPVAQTTDELMVLLQEGRPAVSYTGTAGTDGICEALAYARQNGYRVESKKQSDASDPGGCMSLLEAHDFTKVSN